MRLVLLDAPARRKGYWAFLKAGCACRTSPPGDLLRLRSGRAGTPLGLKARRSWTRASSSPTTSCSACWRISQGDAIASGFILDGYQRNLAQCEALEKLLARIRTADRHRDQAGGAERAYRGSASPAVPRRRAVSTTAGDRARALARLRRNRFRPVASHFARREQAPGGRRRRGIATDVTGPHPRRAPPERASALKPSAAAV